MSPPNLQGLNVVHPRSPAGDARDLIGHPYPDLAAQLDLWTNLAFDSDEGPLVTKDSPGRKTADDDDDARSPNSSVGPGDVVTHVNSGINQPDARQQEQQQSFDISSFLAGFGIDPFAVPHQPSAAAPTLAQLLALHTPHFTLPAAAASLATPAQQQKPKSTEKQAQTTGTDEGTQPAKKARNRRAPENLAAAPVDGTLTADQAVVLAAEDKRRRNTAASARFRLKKKEREAALEGKAKELEMRVSELERECETLRRENGWLKGLVIGVTGAAQAPVMNGPSFTTTGKRRREDGGDA
ncbi:hypothetical protein AX15_003243 [Amanita polypyramis BW_CC]|nr:hypothetical protein AX15_003243 [Amanita polypyramis BW_CC]